MSFLSDKSELMINVWYEIPTQIRSAGICENKWDAKNVITFYITELP